MWTGRLRRWALRTLPAGQAPARPSARLRGLVDLRLRRRLAGHPGTGHRLGIPHRLGGPDWWHTNPVGHFFNSMHLWSVELFMAFWSSTCGGSSGWRPGAARRRATWITGVVAFLAVDRRVLHRLPLPAELRLAVDLDQRQGRLQRRRGGRLLQPHELRPDAAVARGAHPHRAGGHRRRPRSAGAGAGGGAPAARPPRPEAGRPGGPRPRPTPRSGAAQPAATTS